ncbi:uncharacterized protein [Amphiura filiformis]|uniref:uncharacterized protein n=1 Tax=Amphiura filiformis TaxID=82378 RepID=UPI003B20EA90
MADQNPSYHHTGGSQRRLRRGAVATSNTKSELQVTDGNSSLIDLIKNTTCERTRQSGSSETAAASAAAASSHHQNSESSPESSHRKKHKRAKSKSTDRKHKHKSKKSKASKRRSSSTASSSAACPSKKVARETDSEEEEQACSSNHIDSLTNKGTITSPDSDRGRSKKRIPQRSPKRLTATAVGLNPTKELLPSEVSHLLGPEAGALILASKTPQSLVIRIGISCLI